MQAGFMCLESGLTRSKNSINVAVKNLADFGISAGLFWLFGYALMFGDTQTGWLGSTGFAPAFTDQPDRRRILSVPNDVLWHRHHHCVGGGG
jgi:Amt family ammonium transporter